MMSSNEEQLQLELREAFIARARELGISEAAMEDALSHDPGIASRSGAAGEIRVMQWNILADGLARDGFIVRDVLSGAADGEFEYERVVLEMVMCTRAELWTRAQPRPSFILSDRRETWKRWWTGPCASP